MAYKWGQVVRYSAKHGYSIEPGKGGEKTIVAPPGKIPAGPQSRQSVRISHLCCNSNNDVLFGCYVSKLRNVLGFDMKELAKS
jgi:hypothetical protein